MFISYDIQPEGREVDEYLYNDYPADTDENDVIGTSYATTQSSAISMSGTMSRQIKYDWQADNFRV